MTVFVLISTSGLFGFDVHPVLQILQETSPSVVFIKDLEIAKSAKGSGELMLTGDDDAKLEGTGSGFIWDKFGHIVRTLYSFMFRFL